jgi:hypothetical protein
MLLNKLQINILQWLGHVERMDRTRLELTFKGKRLMVQPRTRWFQPGTGRHQEEWKELAINQRLHEERRDWGYFTH